MPPKLHGRGYTADSCVPPTLTTSIISNTSDGNNNPSRTTTASHTHYSRDENPSPFLPHYYDSNAQENPFALSSMMAPPRRTAVATPAADGRGNVEENPSCSTRTRRSSRRHRPAAAAAAAAAVSFLTSSSSPTSSLIRTNSPPHCYVLSSGSSEEGEKEREMEVIVGERGERALRFAAAAAAAAAAPAASCSSYQRNDPRRRGGRGSATSRTGTSGATMAATTTGTGMMKKNADIYSPTLTAVKRRILEEAIAAFVSQEGGKTFPEKEEGSENARVGGGAVEEEKEKRFWPALPPRVEAHRRRAMEIAFGGEEVRKKKTKEDEDEGSEEVPKSKNPNEDENNHHHYHYCNNNKRKKKQPPLPQNNDAQSRCRSPGCGGVDQMLSPVAGASLVGTASLVEEELGRATKRRGTVACREGKNRRGMIDMQGRGKKRSRGNDEDQEEDEDAEEAEEEEEELVVSSVEFSLLCPYALCPIQFPVRSRHCAHLQCCDLESWMVMMSKTRGLRDPSTSCPYCQQRVAASSLEVDLWILHLSREVMPAGTKLIILERNGEVRSGDLCRVARKWTKEYQVVVEEVDGGGGTASPREKPDFSLLEVDGDEGEDVGGPDGLSLMQGSGRGGGESSSASFSAAAGAATAAFLLAASQSIPTGVKQEPVREEEEEELEEERRRREISDGVERGLCSFHGADAVLVGELEPLSFPLPPSSSPPLPPPSSLSSLPSSSRNDFVSGTLSTERQAEEEGRETVGCGTGRLLPATILLPTTDSTPTLPIAIPTSTTGRNNNNNFNASTSSSSSSSPTVPPYSSSAHHVSPPLQVEEEDQHEDKEEEEEVNGGVAVGWLPPSSCCCSIPSVGTSRTAPTTTVPTSTRATTRVLPSAVRRLWHIFCPSCGNALQCPRMGKVAGVGGGGGLPSLPSIERLHPHSSGSSSSSTSEDCTSLSSLHCSAESGGTRTPRGMAGSENPPCSSFSASSSSSFPSSSMEVGVMRGGGGGKRGNESGGLTCDFPSCTSCGWKGECWEEDCTLVRFFLACTPPLPFSSSSSNRSNHHSPPPLLDENDEDDNYFYPHPSERGEQGEIEEEEAEWGGEEKNVDSESVGKRHKAKTKKARMAMIVASMELTPDGTLLLRGMDNAAEYLRRGGFSRSLFISPSTLTSTSTMSTTTTTIAAIPFQANLLTTIPRTFSSSSSLLDWTSSVGVTSAPLWKAITVIETEEKADEATGRVGFPSTVPPPPSSSSSSGGGRGAGEAGALPPPTASLGHPFVYNGVWSSSFPFSRMELDFLEACGERIASSFGSCSQCGKKIKKIGGSDHQQDADAGSCLDSPHRSQHLEGRDSHLQCHHPHVYSSSLPSEIPSSVSQERRREGVEEQVRGGEQKIGEEERKEGIEFFQTVEGRGLVPPLFRLPWRRKGTGGVGAGGVDGGWHVGGSFTRDKMSFGSQNRHAWCSSSDGGNAWHYSSSPSSSFSSFFAPSFSHSASSSSASHDPSSHPSCSVSLGCKTSDGGGSASRTHNNNNIHHHHHPYQHWSGGIGTGGTHPHEATDPSQRGHVVTAAGVQDCGWGTGTESSSFSSPPPPSPSHSPPAPPLSSSSFSATNASTATTAATATTTTTTTTTCPRTFSVSSFRSGAGRGEGLPPLPSPIHVVEDTTVPRSSSKLVFPSTNFFS